jgi:flagellar hook assembly protein FlgD
MTAVRFEIPDEDHVTLDVLDIQGRRVRQLQHERQAAGPHSVLFDGRDERGNRLAPGIYLIRLVVRGGIRIARVVVLP